MKILLILLLNMVFGYYTLFGATSIKPNALLDLYNNTNWRYGDPCDKKWYEITCDYNNGSTGIFKSVVKVDLHNNGLNGTIADSISKIMSGTIQNNLTKLTSLSTSGLRLQGNCPFTFSDTVVDFIKNHSHRINEFVEPIVILRNSYKKCGSNISVNSFTFGKLVRF